MSIKKMTQIQFKVEEKNKLIKRIVFYKFLTIKHQQKIFKIETKYNLIVKLM